MCSPCLPLPELLEDDAVGEALSADPDPLQNPVTPELVQDQVGLQLTSLVGDRQTGRETNRHKTHYNTRIETKSWIDSHQSSRSRLKTPKMS